MYNIIYQLYRKGPSLNGFGFWCGKHDHEICSILTNVESSLWIINKEECNQIIKRHYESFEITVYTFASVIFIYKMLYLMSTYIFIVKPIERAIHMYNTNHKYINGDSIEHDVHK